uniref:Uncharacterized protein n=1 Tax=Nelumbo nucifera TaxID=4432 RepID=A0A822XKV8_NELNU|nr:TPA_asm: hypothetical protein HUJ06_021234 [Nelumbo nucifera]
MTFNLGVQVPDVEMKHLVVRAVFLRGIEGILLISGNSFGAIPWYLHLNL